MKGIFSSKKFLLTTIGVLSISLVGTSVYAGTQARKVTAYQNAGIQLKVDGSRVTPTDGMVPLVYDGHTYVSAKDLSEALGATMKWNASSQTVEITSGAGGGSSSSYDPSLPTKDNSSSGSSTDKPSGKSTSSSTDVVQWYSKSTSASEMFNDNKAAAMHYFSLLADAYKTGDTNELEKWVKDNIQPTDIDMDYSESDAKNIAFGVKNWRESYDKDSVRNTYISSAKEKIKAFSFGSDSKYEDETYSKTLVYTIKIDLDGYTRTMTVNFMFGQMNDTGKWYLKSIV